MPVGVPAKVGCPDVGDHHEDLGRDRHRAPALSNGAQVTKPPTPFDAAQNVKGTRLGHA